jgi:hypothetical protein
MNPAQLRVLAVAHRCLEVPGRADYARFRLLVLALCHARLHLIMNEKPQRANVTFACRVVALHVVKLTSSSIPQLLIGTHIKVW